MIKVKDSVFFYPPVIIILKPQTSLICRELDYL